MAYVKVLVRKKSGRKALTEAEREQRALARHELIATTYAPGLRAQIDRAGDSDVDRGMSADNRLKYNLGNGGRQIIPNRPAY